MASFDSNILHNKYPSWGDGKICLDNKQMKVFQLIREFYALEAMSVMAHPIPFNHGHDKWVEEFNEFKSAFVNQLAKAMFDYMVLVCLGEARHAKNKCDYDIAIFENLPGSFARNDCYACPHFEPRNLLLTFAELFEESWTGDRWADGYGGNAWADIAKGALLYYTMSPEVFIDHAVDLSHNNGVFFNKKNYIFVLNSDENDVKTFLDFKRKAIPEAVWALCKNCVSYETQKLYERAINLGVITKLTNEKLEEVYTETYGISKSPEIWNDDTVDKLMSYIPIKWGTTRLYPSDIIFTNNYLQVGRRRREENEDNTYTTTNRFDRKGIHFYV